MERYKLQFESRCIHQARKWSSNFGSTSEESGELSFSRDSQKCQKTLTGCSGFWYERRLSRGSVMLHAEMSGVASSERDKAGAREGSIRRGG